MKNLFLLQSFSLLCVITMLFSCRTIKVIEPSSEFLSLLDSNRVIPDNRLNFEGIYDERPRKIAKKTYRKNIASVDSVYAYTYKPIFFFKNGLIALNDYGVSFDSVTFCNNLKELGTKKFTFNSWGVYKIDNDTIKATIYMQYGQDGYPATIFSPTNYEGVILSKTSIVNWHVVPPYSDEALLYYKERNLDDYFKVQNLYFKSLPITLLVNPENAWINKFKKK